MTSSNKDTRLDGVVIGFLLVGVAYDRENRRRWGR